MPREVRHVSLWRPAPLMRPLSPMDNELVDQVRTAQAAIPYRGMCFLQSYSLYGDCDIPPFVTSLMRLTLPITLIVSELFSNMKSNFGWGDDSLATLDAIVTNLNHKWKIQTVEDFQGAARDFGFENIWTDVVKTTGWDALNGCSRARATIGKMIIPAGASSALDLHIETTPSLSSPTYLVVLSVATWYPARPTNLPFIDPLCCTCTAWPLSLCTPVACVPPACHPLMTHSILTCSRPSDGRSHVVPFISVPLNCMDTCMVC